MGDVVGDGLVFVDFFSFSLDNIYIYDVFIYLILALIFFFIFIYSCHVIQFILMNLFHHKTAIFYSSQGKPRLNQPHAGQRRKKKEI